MGLPGLMALMFQFVLVLGGSLTMLSPRYRRVTHMAMLSNDDE